MHDYPQIALYLRTPRYVIKNNLMKSNALLESGEIFAMIFVFAFFSIFVKGSGYFYLGKIRAVVSAMALRFWKQIYCLVCFGCLTLGVYSFQGCVLKGQKWNCRITEAPVIFSPSVTRMYIMKKIG